MVSTIGPYMLQNTGWSKNGYPVLFLG